MTEQIADDDVPSPLLDHIRPRPTGAVMVTLQSNASIGKVVDSVRRLGGPAMDVRLASDGQPSGPVPQDGQVLVFEDLMTAIVDPPKRQGASSMMAALNTVEDVEEVRPEVYFFSLQEFRDTPDATWGVGATRAAASPFTGKGIKICILDTGIDVTHPDLSGRTITARSFVPGEDVADRQGHGTHCAGTAAGNVRSPGVPRYGVAPDADLYVGKVLNNSGSGAERWIIAGMQWAVSQGCDIISMSLGSPVQPGQRFSTLYERIARQALDAGSLILAAAGNDSNRTFGVIAPVSSPADSPSILAVGAVDPLYRPCFFSNGGINPGGGEIDLVAPGAGVFSSTPRPQIYRTMDGTSMACPHAAGIAALWAEAYPGTRGRALWQILTKNARPLPNNIRDVGSGLAIAPIAIEIA